MLTSTSHTCWVSKSPALLSLPSSCKSICEEDTLEKQVASLQKCQLSLSIVTKLSPGIILLVKMTPKGEVFSFLFFLTELSLCTGAKYTFTIKEGADGKNGRISVNYDGFIDDVSVNDMLLVDGGMLSLKILEKTKQDVVCEVVDGGVMGSRYAPH